LVLINRKVYVIKSPAVHVRSQLSVGKFTAGAVPFGDFSLGEQGKVTRVQGGAPAKSYSIDITFTL
jgi:hypothetical protein